MIAQLERTKLAARILADGPLQHREFVAITGWLPSECSRTLQNLKRNGKATCENHERYTVWRLL